MKHKKESLIYSDTMKVLTVRLPIRIILTVLIATRSFPESMIFFDTMKVLILTVTQRNILIVEMFQEVCTELTHENCTQRINFYFDLIVSYGTKLFPYVFHLKKFRKYATYTRWVPHLVNVGYKDSTPCKCGGWAPHPVKWFRSRASHPSQ